MLIIILQLLCLLEFEINLIRTMEHNKKAQKIFRFTMFYKISMATIVVEYKCARCKNNVKVNLALTKSNFPLFYRKAVQTLWTPLA